MGQQPSMKEEDFFKEDYMTSPRFKADPEGANRFLRVRFTDKREKMPVKRSHVGSIQDYTSMSSVVDKEKLVRLRAL